MSEARREDPIARVERGVDALSASVEALRSEMRTEFARVGTSLHTLTGRTDRFERKLDSMIDRLFPPPAAA